MRLRWSARVLVAAAVLAHVRGERTLVTLQPAGKPCMLNGNIENACCAYGTAEVLNESLWPMLDELCKTSFFRFVKIHLNKPCPFWRSNAQCMNEGCGINVMTDDDLAPEARFLQRTQGLADVNFPSSSQLTPGSSLSTLIRATEHNPRDFCLVEDESSSDGQYVDLLDNPEQFTGYAGPTARNVWEAIYFENCFNLFDANMSNSENNGASTLAELVSGKHHDDADVCLEKRVFYRIISGLHSSISIHICSSYPDTTRRPIEWGHNLTCYINRIGKWRGREQNLYFNYAIMLRAMRKISSYLNRYDYDTGNLEEQVALTKMMKQLTGNILSCQKTFDETQLFFGPGSAALRMAIQSKFTNISRIMDCVTCQKCRLWGKTQITGIGTALKILFTLDKKLLSSNITPIKPVLSRYEIVALINTLARFAESIRDIQIFRKMHENEFSTPISKSEPVISTPVTNTTPTKPITTVKSTDTTTTSFVDKLINPTYWRYMAAFCSLCPFLVGVYFTMRIQPYEMDTIEEPLDENEPTTDYDDSNDDNDVAESEETVEVTGRNTASSVQARSKQRSKHE